MNNEGKLIKQHEEPSQKGGDEEMKDESHDTIRMPNVAQVRSTVNATGQLQL